LVVAADVDIATCKLMAVPSKTKVFIFTS